MTRILAASLALLVVSPGCKSDKTSTDQKPAPTPETPPADSPEPPAGDVVQPRIGGDPDEARTDLGFEIVKVYEKQKPSDAAPFHEDGGKWTFFDAKVGEAQFTFGLESQPLEGVPFERATARIAAMNPESASKLVGALASAFHVAAPAADGAAKQPKPPLEMAGVVLGRGLKANPDGSYSGSGGDWVTCKWTIERDGDAAEVFLNFNLAKKRGVFSEKDAMYRDNLIKWLGASL